MKNWNRSIRIALAVVAAVLLCGCAHYPLNQPLDTAGQAAPYAFDRFTEPAGADETFVILTFSGGGTRAAALSYGVLKKMRDIRLPDGRSLLGEVDVISTVSGGSFTGAYYALFGERIFDDFEERFLNRNIECELLLKLANPYNWARLASPWFSRIDLAAELYHETIFDEKTFASLAEKAARPFLIVNATNLSTGARFEFTGRQFHCIGSDLLTYPVARAVAASSAFPFLLAPVSLANHCGTADCAPDTEDTLALRDYWKNKRRYWAAYNNTIYADREAHPWLHLMDGGLADNLGLRAIYDLYVRSDIRRKINNGKIKRLLVIVVNAKTEKHENLDLKESPPGLKTVGLKTATVSMDNYSFETVEMFREAVGERIKAQEYLTACQDLLDRHSTDGYKLPTLAGGNLKLYVADLCFNNLSDEQEKEYFNNLPTSFNLSETEVDRLIDIGSRLLVEHPEYKKFMGEY